MKYIAALSGLVAAGTLLSGRAEASEDSGLDLGLRLGYGIPLGSIANAPAGAGVGTSLSDYVSGQVPIWVDAGYRFTPNIMAGLYFQYGFAFPSDTVCQNTSSCSGSDVRFGVQGQYRISPHESVDPWLGIGVGYEWLTLSTMVAGLDSSLGLRGWEFLHLQGGVDFKVADGFGVGPFIDFSLAEYMTGSADGGGTSISGDVRDKALHEWLTLGVRGVYDP
jgi:outer membrane protein W